VFHTHSDKSLRLVEETKKKIL